MNSPTEPRTRYRAIVAWALTLFGFVVPCVAQEPAPGRNREAGAVFRDCPACPEMVVVPAGSIIMGLSELSRDEEGPRRRVTIGAPFAVGVYEVTFAEWDACVDRGGCGGYRPADSGRGRGRQPVRNVSWIDAQAYLQWLSGETGQEYRLLRVAEWEYVARAGGTVAARYAAETDAASCQVDPDLDPEDWHPDWVGCPGHVQTAPVGSLEPNAFGLHDVLGNAWELTEDCGYNVWDRWVPTDSSTPGDCTVRQSRGGSLSLVGGLVRGMFQTGISINSREFGVGFRVARAVADGDGLNIALLDDGYRQLFLRATGDDRLSLVEALLDAGADPNGDRCGAGCIPLFTAVSSASPGVVTALLEAGADPNARRTDYYHSSETPLHHTLVEAPEELGQTVTLLLDHGADVNARRGDGLTPLHVAVKYRRSGVVVSTLLVAGADRDLTALQLASLHNDQAAVASLLARGVDPDEPDQIGWTPLHFAMINDSPVTIASLVDAGADPNAVDAHGDTPLIRYLAAGASNADPEDVVVRALLNGGADPNMTDSNGWAPLHFATRYGVRPAVVTALLDAGADPNAVDELSEPPLINFLRSNRDRWDDREGSVAVVQALLRAGADPNLGTGYLRGSLLHVAIRSPVHPAIISLLLDAGADPFARDDQGQLPIDLAEQNWLRTTDVYERLRALGRESLFRRLHRFLAAIFG